MTQNNNNQDYTNGSDGFTLGGGTTKRKLQVTGADVTITGSGTNTYTFPDTTSTLASEAYVDSKAITYSTSETLTGNTWIDGKPIYRKVVNTGSLPNATTKNVAHGISTIENLVTISGLAYDGSLRITMPFAAGGGGDVAVYASSTAIVFNSYLTNRSGFSTSYVILEYTKV